MSRGWIECEIVTLAGSRWVSNYYITPATGSSDQLERRCWNENHVPAKAGPQAPCWAAQENGKERLWLPEEWGSVCCSSVQCPTHLSHSKTFRNPFEQSERYIFLKNCVRSSLLCRHVSVCIGIWVYNNHSWRNKRIHIFPEDISPKMNI